MTRPKPRLYKGFRDVFASDLIAKQRMIDALRSVCERYGLMPLETPAIEYVDVLGKSLQDQHSPAGGIFSFRNPDLSEKHDPAHPDYWLGLRYDLTASLARVVAQYQELQRPFRRYQIGEVWRHEKPGPGRYRQFLQFDFDTVGTASMAADAEVCCIICDAFEALGFAPGEYAVKVNNRKVLQGVLEACGLEETDITAGASQAAAVLRAIDKLDRLGLDGVKELLGEGRRDPSGDYTKGAGLEAQQIGKVEQYLSAQGSSRAEVCNQLAALVGNSVDGREGVDELEQIDGYLRGLGYGEDRVIFDPTVVRGLSYYTGPVFEGVLTGESASEGEAAKQFGSIFGGGRYDNLVERFTGQKVPATGASVGVDRLLAALEFSGKLESRRATADVLVTTMDPGHMDDYLRLAQELRRAGVNTEVYLGSAGIGAQLKYADKCGIPLAVIAGSEEFSKGEFQVKNLRLGKQLAEDISGREEWLKDRPAQQSVKQDKIVASIKELLSSIS